MDNSDKISGKKVSQTRFFKEARAAAKEFAKEPDKLRDLVEKAREKAKGEKSGPIGDVWDALMTCFRLLVAYAKGEYREIPWKSLISIIGSVVYFMMPADFIPDIIVEISEEVKMFSGRFDYVFTSGGIGPTHDDVTIEGIAKAFNVSPVIDSTFDHEPNRKCAVERCQLPVCQTHL